LRPEDSAGPLLIIALTLPNAVKDPLRWGSLTAATPVQRVDAVRRKNLPAWKYGELLAAALPLVVSMVKI
jgi:hypothetical protein